MRHVELTDVIVATVLPFDEQGGIDWASFRRLLDYCAAPDGIGAVFVNGHAGEGAALTREERIRVIEATRDHLGPSRLLLAGVIPYCTREAVEQARDAKAHGADVAVLFPIPSFAAGGAGTAAPVSYVRTVVEEAGMPVSIFQYPLASGCGYPTETLMRIAALPGVVAIKEGSDTMTAYEGQLPAPQVRGSARRHAPLELRLVPRPVRGGGGRDPVGAREPHPPPPGGSLAGDEGP